MCSSDLWMDANLVAHCANLGYIEEAAIRNHILQSLISHPILRIHQLVALYVLFKIAGATFAAYVDPTVVDRCFELIEDRLKSDSWKWIRELMQASVVSVKGLTLELRHNFRR